MKIKRSILILLVFVLCGCMKVQDTSIENIISQFSSEIKMSDIYHKGYKYYLPENMQVTKYLDYNDVIEDSKYHYYLYVDIISYNSKKENTYEANDISYYSSSINNDKKIGYLEINKMENAEYLIEIMYNYAKIEVMVDENDIKNALTKAVSILRSIKYNDSIIKKLTSENKIVGETEEYNIFNTTSKDSNYLKFIEEEIEESDVQEEITDTDLIN